MVTNTVTGMMDKTKEAVHGGVEMTRSAVASGMNTMMGSSMGQMVASSMGAVLGKSEELVDHYLPMTDEELGEMMKPVISGEPDMLHRAVKHRSDLSVPRGHKLMHMLGTLESTNI